jgi:hypothetical protein
LMNPLAISILSAIHPHFWRKKEITMSVDSIFIRRKFWFTIIKNMEVINQSSRNIIGRMRARTW